MLFFVVVVFIYFFTWSRFVRFVAFYLNLFEVRACERVCVCVCGVPRRGDRERREPAREREREMAGHTCQTDSLYLRVSISCGVRTFLSLTRKKAYSLVYNALLLSYYYE